MRKYALPELPYGYSDLEPHYSARLLELHHGKHHAAYVAGANATLEKLVAAREQRQFEAINQLQKNLAFHVSGHVLHSLFWRNMCRRGGGPPEGELAAAVRESFGSFGALQGQMTAAALNVQGSGWATVAWEPVGQRLVVERSTTTRATSATARCRCWFSTCGSTPTTSSTNTSKATGSRRSGS
jgi:Fe-Mn family superoxide dismutase